MCVAAVWLWTNWPTSRFCGVGVSDWVVIWWGNAKHLQLFLMFVCIVEFAFCINLLHTGYYTVSCYSFPPARWGYWCDLSGVEYSPLCGSRRLEQICTLRCNLKLWEGGLRVGQTVVIGSACPPALRGCTFSTLPKRKRDWQAAFSRLSRTLRSRAPQRR